MEKNQRVLFAAARSALFLRVEPGVGSVGCSGGWGGGLRAGGGSGEEEGRKKGGVLGGEEREKGETVQCWLAW